MKRLPHSVIPGPAERPEHGIHNHDTSILLHCVSISLPVFMDSGLDALRRPGMTREGLANAALPGCFAPARASPVPFSVSLDEGMERREAPGAIDGRPLGGPLSGARLHAVTEACARPSQRAAPHGAPPAECELLRIPPRGAGLISGPASRPARTPPRVMTAWRLPERGRRGV
jgi:hypothetical protein